MSLKITGKNPTGNLLGKIKTSRNYKKNGFENLSPTPIMRQDASYFDLLKKFLFKNKDAKPGYVLPSFKTDLKNMQALKPAIVWLGHSSYFIKIQNKNILVDPVLSASASPLAFIVRAFEGSNVYSPDDFPEIDFLILTHDHYDHLDYKALRELRPKIKMIYCSLGLSSHLVYWDFEGEKIVEMDWWQTRTLSGDLILRAVPARHFSGRGFKRFKTLWSSYILKASDYNLFLGGDSGYGTHFKETGEKFGPFDIAILESGQYNTAWPLIHMMPEQTVQAAADLEAKLLLPVHWGKFSLALHAWDEPVKRVLTAAKKMNMKVTTPMIGELVILDEDYPTSRWWEL